MVKNSWKTPAMEVLQISQTMEGFGIKYTDGVVFDKDGNPIDLDITDTPPAS